MTKILKGALIAAVGAVLTYGTQAIPTVDIPEAWLPLVVAGWSVVANIVRKAIGAAKPQ